MTSVAQDSSTRVAGPGSGWLLLVSLALNLFFVGVAVAMAIRAPAPRWDPNVFVRVERLADALPPADGDIVRAAMQANHAAIDDAQSKYIAARDSIRATLRQDPFKAEDLRAAMARTRTARQTFDTVIQGVFADAAAKMSPAGRHALADWRSSRSPNGKPQ